MLIMLFILLILCLLFVIVEKVLVKKKTPAKERIVKQVPLLVLILFVVAGLVHLTFY